MDEGGNGSLWDLGWKLAVVSAFTATLQTTVPIGLKSPYLDQLNSLVTRGSFEMAHDLVFAEHKRFPQDPLRLSHELAVRVNDRAYENVVEELDREIEASSSRDAQLAKALLLGSGEERSRILAKLLSQDPSHHAAQELYVAQRAYELSQSGKLEDAVVLAQQACREGCVTSHAPLQLASLLMQMGNRLEALRYIEVGIRVNPFDPMGYLMLATFHLEGGESGRALEILDHALDVAPRSIALHYLRAEVLRSAGEELEALKSYERAISLEAGRSEDYDFRGSAYLALGKKQEAIRDFEKAVALMPRDPGARVLLADAYAASGNRARALELWLATVDQNTRHVPALLSLAAHYLEQRDFARVETLSERVLSVQPNQIDAQWMKASALLGERRLDEAIPLLERVRKTIAEKKGALAVEIEKKLGSAYEIRWLQTRREEALAEWKTLAWDPWKEKWLGERFGTQETAHFLVVSDLGPYYRERYGRILEVFHDALVKRFGIPPFEKKVPYIIFTQERDYAAFLDRMGDERLQGGLFLQDFDLFCALRYYADGRYRSIGGLLQVVAGRFLRDQPPWVAQGFASLFETSSVVQGELVFGSLSSERAKILKKALLQWAGGGELEDVFAYRGQDLMDHPDYFEKAYAVHVMLHQLGALEPFVKRLLSKEPAREALSKVLPFGGGRLEEEFQSSVQKLVLPAALVEEAYEAAEQGESEKAVFLFQQATGALPHWGMGHYEFAAYLLEQEDPLRALEEFRSALLDSEMPYPAQATARAGYALWDLGAKELGLALLSSVEKYDAYEVHLDSYLFYLSRYLEESGRSHEALAAYRKYLTLIEANAQLEGFRASTERAIRSLEHAPHQAA